GWVRAHLLTAQSGPKSQCLARRQPRFDAVLMADIMQPGTMPGDVVGDCRCAPGEPTSHRLDQAGEEPQQARFAAAVGARQNQGAADRQPEAEPTEDQPVPTPAGKTFPG